MGKIRTIIEVTSLIAKDSAELAHDNGIELSIRHHID